MLTFLLPLTIKPRLKKVDIRDDPPAETSGRGSPVIGNIPKFIPILINDSKINIDIVPIPKYKNISLFVTEITVAMRKNKVNRNIKTATDPKKPSSSDIPAKIKSVCFSGKYFN